VFVGCDWLFSLFPIHPSILPQTDEYVVKIRALQALCVMSGCFTSDIADIACKRIYEAMEKGNAHNQVCPSNFFRLEC